MTKHSDEALANIIKPLFDDTTKNEVGWLYFILVKWFKLRLKFNNRKRIVVQIKSNLLLRIFLYNTRTLKLFTINQTN